MRQAIQTKYLGPTDNRGARVKAMCDAGSHTVPWDHAADVTDNHTLAAKALADRLGWVGQWLGGALGDGYVYVCADSDGWVSDVGVTLFGLPRAKPLSKGKAK